MQSNLFGFFWLARSVHWRLMVRLFIVGVGLLLALAATSAGARSMWIASSTLGGSRNVNPVSDVLITLVDLDVVAGSSSESVVDAATPSTTASPYDPPSATDHATTLPPCKRTLLYKFAGLHGFASEFGIYLRVFIIGQHYGYAVISDDSAWNYGRLSDYFDPPALDCVVPANWRSLPRTRAGTRAGHTRDETLEESLGSGQPKWTKSAHVWMDRDIDYLDALFLRLFVNTTALQRMHDLELETPAPEPPLSGQMTLPSLFDRAFAAEVDALERVWRPNALMRQMISEAQAQLNPVSVPGEFAPITIAAHIRLGDKSGELAQFGPHRFAPPGWTPPAGIRVSTGFSDSTVHRIGQYMAAAHSIYDDALSETGQSRRGKPRLLVMSDDPQAGNRVTKAASSKWEVITSAQLSGDLSATRLLRRRKPRSEKLRAALAGFIEKNFNLLPAATRIAETRVFVRDLSVLGRISDGVVFTSSSNAGRLLSLLGGKVRLLSPGRRMRSLDVRWFPTSRYQ